ncbi:CvpA family protein [uncultured Fibrobacter sp.]|uniref:CvpA family protein n=1 Tax=uncultured Fibrobacter sp. TaxID=261512 RepID=UPI002606C1B0|nr:CvpA family protein [uncultured Fibrobacter sp.]
MNAIDIVSLILILILMLLGLWRGFLHGIFRLLAWACAIMGAYFAQKLLADFISGLLETSSFSTTLVCICIGFLVPFLVVSFIGHLVSKYTKDTVVGKVDRILGGIFGVIKALLIIFVLLTILHILPFGGIVHETRDASVSYTAYKGTLEMMGYSSEPVDLVGVAERKASAFTKNLTEKASEKAEAVAKDAADKAADAAKEAVIDAAGKAVAKAKGTAAASIDTATAKEVKDKAVEKVQKDK